ncbi:MAG TPA: hypothetical protein VMD77_05740 [Candidatus Baltobacteraceae bacterium]|nr:hypothetical protein [Candidatus Baltobacteraceae bacterium]
MPTHISAPRFNFFACRPLAGNRIAHFIVEIREEDATMKNKRRAVFLLLFVGGLLALASAWDLPEDHHSRRAA